MANIKSSKVYDTLLKTYDGRVVQKEDFTGKITKEQVRAKAQALSNAYAKKGWDGIIIVSLWHPDWHPPWRNGQWTQASHNVDLYEVYDDEDDPQEFTKFSIYYLRNPKRAGKCDNNLGDCYYKSLKAILRTDMPKEWSSAAKFKKWLGIERSAGVTIEHQAKIDEKIKGWKIKVKGDYAYQSTKKCTRIAEIDMLNGHFKPAKVTELHVGASYTEKIPLLYEKMYENGEQQFTVCDGKTVWKMSKSEFYGHTNDWVNSPYVKVPIDKLPTELKDLMAIYKEYIENVEKLEKATKGRINMKKTGTFTKTILKLFEYDHTHLNPDAIRQMEAEWIEDATVGAIVRTEIYKGKLYKYDFKSYFSGILRHKLMYWPIKEGEFKHVTQEQFKIYKKFFRMTDEEKKKLTSEEIGAMKLPYGIYKCDINEVDPRYYVRNTMGKYTHIDIELAVRFGFKVELSNDEINALIYTRDKLVTGTQLFSKYVDYLYPLKEAKVPYADILLQRLWGVLTRTNKKKKDCEEFTLPEHHTYKAITQLSKKKYHVEFVKNETYFDTNYARIKPFLLARSRFLLCRVIQPIIKDVKRVHTDSIFSKKPLTAEYLKEFNVTLGKEIGNLDYKGFCEEAEVIKGRKPKGDFIIA